MRCSHLRFLAVLSALSLTLVRTVRPDAYGWVCRVRIGGFVSLGPSPAAPPTYLGAAAAGALFAEAPSVSYAACSSGTVNSAAYENAFYAAGHEFGHPMGLPHTDDYGVSLPINWQESIMFVGKGTDSELFPFEVSRLLTFLNSW
jgi:hypothetical protein